MTQPNNHIQIYQMFNPASMRRAAPPPAAAPVEARAAPRRAAATAAAAAWGASADNDADADDDGGPGGAKKKKVAAGGRGGGAGGAGGADGCKSGADGRPVVTGFEGCLPLFGEASVAPVYKPGSCQAYHSGKVAVLEMMLKAVRDSGSGDKVRTVIGGGAMRRGCVAALARGCCDDQIGSAESVDPGGGGGGRCGAGSGRRASACCYQHTSFVL